MTERGKRGIYSGKGEMTVAEVLESFIVSSSHSRSGV